MIKPNNINSIPEITVLFIEGFKSVGCITNSPIILKKRI